MVRRTKEASLVTRERLLDAAEALFRDHGVTRTSLADVAKRAGMTRGAVYWHFRDKADLFRALFERATLPLEADFARVDAVAGTHPLAALRCASIAALRRLAADSRTQNVFEIVFHKCELVDDLTGLATTRRVDRGHCIEQIADVMRRAVDAGELPADTDPTLAAHGVHATMVGIMHEWVLDPAAYDLAAAAPALVEMIVAGLRAAPPRRPRGADKAPHAAGHGRARQVASESTP